MTVVARTILQLEYIVQDNSFTDSAFGIAVSRALPIVLGVIEFCLRSSLSLDKKSRLLSGLKLLSALANRR